MPCYSPIIPTLNIIWEPEPISKIAFVTKIGNLQ